MLLFRALALIGIVACGDNTLPLDLFRSTQIDVRCEHDVRCGVFSTLDACHAFVVLRPQVSVDAAIAAGIVTYHPDAANTCLESIRSASCSRTSRDVRAPDGCDRVLTGSITEGETCATDPECASGHCKSPATCTDACCRGTCRPLPGADGDACTSDLECQTGLFCSATNTCIALLADGDSCDTDAHCGFGLGCNGGATGTNGKCGAFAQTMESCATKDCDGVGDACGSSEMCVPLAKPQAPCAHNTDCVHDSLCDATTMACTSLPGLGEPCPVGRCTGNTWCEGGQAVPTCAAPQDNGAPCASDDQCATFFCLEGQVFDQCTDAPVCT